MDLEKNHLLEEYNTEIQIMELPILLTFVENG